MRLQGVQHIEREVRRWQEGLLSGIAVFVIEGPEHLREITRDAPIDERPINDEDVGSAFEVDDNTGIALQIPGLHGRLGRWSPDHDRWTRAAPRPRVVALAIVQRTERIIAPKIGIW
jgi:hypothetical protein